MVTDMPLDEDHRFLEWQPNAAECYDWSVFLSSKQVPHHIMMNEHGEYTIYKHMSNIGREMLACCAATKPLSYKDLTGHLATT